MRIPLYSTLESRDGTLAADANLKNAVVENIEGALVVAKRPGITLQTELAPGLAQGLFSLGGVSYGIVNDTFWGPFTPGSGGASSGITWEAVEGAVLPVPCYDGINNVQYYSPISFQFDGKIFVREPLFDSSVLFRTSTDLISWNAVGSYPLNLSPTVAVPFLGMVFLFDFEFSTYVAYSPTGYGWTEVEVIENFPEYVRSNVVVMGSTLYVIGRTGSVTYIYKTTNGTTFTKTAISGIPSTNQDAKRILIAFNGKLYALPTIAGSAYDSVYSSNDGTTWDLVVQHWGVSIQMNYGSSVFDGKIYIAGMTADLYSRVYSMSDGVSWTIEASSSTWTPRWNPLLLTFDVNLIAVGGLSTSGYLYDIWKRVGASSTPSRPL